MITIFSNPRPFLEQFNIIQRNAIKSWMKLSPKCEIILFEDEEKTTSKVCAELGIKCITDVNRDEFGTPLLDDVFNKVREVVNGGIIAQVNADIILTNTFVSGIEKISKIMGEHLFFASGRRWNLEIKEQIDFKKNNWEQKLRGLIKREGKLHGFSGMDYWVLPYNIPFKIPPFIIGRPGMDSWLVFKSRSLKIPVIDSTEVIDIIHQNHNYPKKKNSYFAVEKKRNLELAGGFSNMCTLRDANWILTSKGLKKPSFQRRVISGLTLFYPWRKLLAIKRKMNN